MSLDRSRRGNHIGKVLEEVLGPSSSHLLRSACSSLMSLVETSTPEGGLLVYMFGLRLGERVGEAVKKADPSISPWISLEEVNSYLNMAERIDVLDIGPEGALLRVKGAEEVRKQGGMGGCNFLRGFVAGFFSTLTGQLVLVEESGCCELKECQLKVIISPHRGVASSSARRAIIEYLRVNPGAYLRQMSRDLGMSLGSLRWHLNVLERSGLVWERRKGNMIEFYLSDVL